MKTFEEISGFLKNLKHYIYHEYTNPDYVEKSIQLSILEIHKKTLVIKFKPDLTYDYSIYRTSDMKMSKRLDMDFIAVYTFWELL